MSKKSFSLIAGALLWAALPVGSQTLPEDKGRELVEAVCKIPAALFLSAWAAATRQIAASFWPPA